MVENDIQNAILQYLWDNKIFAWRNNNQPTFDHKRKAYRKMPKWGMKGVSDILGVYKGRLLAIEVKQKRKYPSSEQYAFLNKVKDEGGISFVARSVDDVAKHLRVFNQIYES